MVDYFKTLTDQEERRDVEVYSERWMLLSFKCKSYPSFRHFTPDLVLTLVSLVPLPFFGVPIGVSNYGLFPDTLTFNRHKKVCDVVESLLLAPGSDSIDIVEKSSTTV